MAATWDGARAWLQGFGRRRSRRIPFDEAVDDPWPTEAVPSAAHPVVALLTEIEQTAQTIYRAHDLPVRPGQYARSPRSRRWKFIADSLAPDERWALVLANTHRGAWRYGALHDLGAVAGSPPDLRAAADLLAGCHLLRKRLRERGSLLLEDDLEAAIRLGALWAEVRQASVWKSASPLRLQAPRKPRPPRP